MKRAALLLATAVLATLAAGCPKLPTPAVVRFTDPLTAEQHSTLGAAHEREGNQTRALQEYAAALKKDPKNLIALTGMGNLALAQKKWKTAATYYQRALDVSPDNAVVWNNLAMARMGDGDLKKALAAADRAVSLDPRDPRLLETRAEVKQAAGNQAGAEADITEAIAICEQLQGKPEMSVVCDRLLK